MRRLEKAVEGLANIDEAKGVYDGINDLINAENSIDMASAIGRVAAEAATGIAITGSIRTAVPGVRLGVAISGQIE